MKIIKTLAEIRILIEEKKWSDNLLKHLELLFFELWESLGNNKAVEHFNLSNHGYIVVLEDKDKLGNQSTDNVTLDPLWHTQTKTNKEPVVQPHQIYILQEDQNEITLITVPVSFDKDVEHWFQVIERH